MSKISNLNRIRNWVTDKRERVSYASRQEVEAALLSLNQTDLIRLKRIAQLRAAANQPMSWEDLLQEGISRALAGSRKWPSTVPFVAFLAQTMRSIASEELAAQVRRAEIAESDLNRDGGISIDALAVDYASPERRMLSRNLLERVNELFSDDSVALAILTGIAQGHTANEIQRMTGLAKKDFDAAQKRIRRGLLREFGERGQL
jgi:DNA-directed RNA polymerase specialized sigma24 family protein